MGKRTTADRSITAAGLARLLARLDPDRDRAAQEYERLRRALVRFFDWRGAWPADECADDTLDRLARKLEDDTHVDDVRGYAHGIARLVFHEWQRRPRFSSIHEGVEEPVEAPRADDSLRLQHCFDRCLAEMEPGARSLVVRYYEGERHARISNRQQLASALGLSDNALRSRVQRLRDGLERCVHACCGTTGD